MEKSLIKTIEDLYKLYPAVEDVAVVPIGVTKYREGLAQVKTFTEETSKKELEMVMKFKKNL